MRIPSAVVPALVLAHAVGAAPCVAQAAGGPEVTAALAVDTRAAARGCLSRADLIARIARRSSRIRVAADGGSTGPALRAVVEAAAPGAVTVSLSFAWPGGTRSERRLSARSCAEAADAVALVIVLALDPGAAAAPAAPRSTPPPAPASSGPAPVAVAPGPNPEPPPVVPPGSVTPAPPPVAEAPASSPGPPPASASASASGAASASALPSASEPEGEGEADSPPIPAISRFRVGAGGRAVNGPAPRWLWGLGLVVGWELERASVWSPLVQVVGSTYARQTSRATGGTATLGLDAIALQLCPVRLGLGLVSLRLCAAASGGRLVARGSETFNPRSGTGSLITAGGAALLAVNPHPRVELTASVEPAAALARDQFTFDPVIFYGVPRLILTLGIGVAVKFP